jgi:hypothetical protein
MGRVSNAGHVGEADQDDDSSSLASGLEPPLYAQSTVDAAASNNSTSKLAIIALRKMSRLHLIGFPKTVYAPDKLGPVLLASWPGGVKKHGWYGVAYEYHFDGKPWGTTGDKAGIESRRLMCVLLGHLYSQGWILQTAYTASHWRWALDSLLFQYVAPASLPEVDWAALIRTYVCPRRQNWVCC